MIIYIKIEMNINNINVPIDIRFGTEDKELRIPLPYELPQTGPNQEFHDTTNEMKPKPVKIEKESGGSPSIILKSHIPQNMYSSRGVNNKKFHDSGEIEEIGDEFHDTIGEMRPTPVKIEKPTQAEVEKIEEASEKFASDKLTKEILREMSEMDQMGMEDVNVENRKHIQKILFSEEDLATLQNIFHNTREGKDKLQGLYIKGDPVAIQVREKPFVKVEDDVYDVETRIEHNKKPSFIWETSYDKISSSLPIWLNSIWKFQKKNNNQNNSSENLLITGEGIYRLTINPGIISSENIDEINKSLRRGILKYTQSVYFDVDSLKGSLEFIEYFNSKFNKSELDFIPYDSKNDSLFVPYKLVKTDPDQPEPIQPK